MTRAVLWTAGIAFALELAFIAVLGYAAGLRVMMIAVAIGFIGRVMARLLAGPPESQPPAGGEQSRPFGRRA